MCVFVYASARVCQRKEERVVVGANGDAFKTTARCMDGHEEEEREEEEEEEEEEEGEGEEEGE